jgi:hypothetical protein
LLQFLEERLGVDFRYADQVIEARLADEDVAKMLGILQGRALRRAADVRGGRGRSRSFAPTTGPTFTDTSSG